MFTQLAGSRSRMDRRERRGRNKWRVDRGEGLTWLMGESWTQIDGGNQWGGYRPGATVSHLHLVCLLSSSFIILYCLFDSRNTSTASCLGSICSNPPYLLVRTRFRQCDCLPGLFLPRTSHLIMIIPKELTIEDSSHGIIYNSINWSYSMRWLGRYACSVYSAYHERLM